MAESASPGWVQQELRELRQRAGYSMAALAKAAGYRGSSSYQRYEDPAAELEYLPLAVGRRLARALAGRGTPPIDPAEVMLLCGLSFEGKKLEGVNLDAASELIREGMERERDNLRSLRGGRTDKTQRQPPKATESRSVLMIDELEAYLGAGGGGIEVLDSNGDRVLGQWGIPADYLRHEVRVRPAAARIIQVKGDSMAPTLHSGDRVMIDTSDRTPSPPGVFALWDGMGVVIKRLDPVPLSEPQRVRVMSDNAAYQTYEVTAEEAQIIGRAIWYGRRL